MSSLKRTLTLNEVINIIEEEDQQFDRVDITIQPPPNDPLTDEDSADEDETGTLDNLSGRQLNSQASATLIRKDGEKTVLEENILPSDTADDHQPTAAKRQKETVTPSTRQWSRRDLPSSNSERFVWNVPDTNLLNLPKDPVELFELFFDEDVFELLTTNTIRYARSKGNHTFTITAGEIQAFIGILLISGYNSVPRRRMYWSYDKDVHNEAISSAMSRDRFDEVQRYLHLCDNDQLDPQDRFSKVKPLLNLLNERFLLFFIEQQNLSVDESMIPYYGRHGAKQFIRGKPIRFGYKMWVLATPLGYVVQFEPYQGAFGRREYAGLGMGGSVIFNLVSKLQNHPYHLTFDNLFTSLKLVDALSAKGIGCTGTVRANRIENCPLKSVYDVGKMERGSFDYAYDSAVGLVVVRWNDNNVVNVVSNYVGFNPIQSTKRWSKKASKSIELPQPFLITHYNKTMGGVDRMDQNVSQYRCAIRSKKWWWPIFNYCIDLCVQQAWHLYRATDVSKEKPMDLLDIRRAIATSVHQKIY